MAVVTRWLASFITASVAYVVIFTIFVAVWAAFGGHAQSISMFGMSFSVLGTILIGTAIAPHQHRKIALWLFVALMCFAPAVPIVVSLAKGGGVPSAIWLDIAGTLGGVFVAPIFARSAIRGCEPKPILPVSMAHPWLKNVGH